MKRIVFNILLLSAMSIFAGEQMTDYDRRWLIGCMINAAEMSARSNMRFGDNMSSNVADEVVGSWMYDRARMSIASNMLDRCANIEVVRDFRREVERIDRMRFDIRTMDRHEVTFAFTNLTRFADYKNWKK